MTDFPERALPRLCVLQYPGAEPLCQAGLIDLFARAQQVAGELGMAKTSSLQLELLAVEDQGVSPTVVFVPPLSGPGLLDAEALAPWLAALRRWHAGGALLMAVCSGAWLLAMAGLLQGRRATLHWDHAMALAAHFPQIKVLPHEVAVDEGDLVTSSGTLAWQHLGLAVLAHYWGASLAVETHGWLHVPMRDEPLPPSPFQPRLEHGNAAVLKVQLWLQGNRAMGVTLDEMAACAGLEPRTFLRRFHACTGLKPTEYCQHLRIARACHLLETSQRNVDQIAASVGYQDVGALRKIFQRVTGYALSEYRDKYGLRNLYRPIALRGRL
ncbi:AraC family transcriptional regulator [Pseudomonas sp. M47T1]|uniref:GlxA family transcriptional regulator n=1 Tax=Pseudomonas sp. M47T1 TaxID=1179778 RepID=UPI00026078EE|nr:helix-turn-helix domain-containing protein [Pseudomonas sp. M47T1]EIK94642.1 AraC family transcriptional regulator [Pseudomonas sp. M47T1]